MTESDQQEQQEVHVSRPDIGSIIGGEGSKITNDSKELSDPESREESMTPEMSEQYELIDDRPVFDPMVKHLNKRLRIKVCPFTNRLYRVENKAVVEHINTLRDKNQTEDEHFTEEDGEEEEEEGEEEEEEDVERQRNSDKTINQSINYRLQDEDVNMES